MTLTLMCLLGSLVTVCGLLTFTSNRSMEIEVIVEYERLFSKQPEEASAVGRQKAVDAFFTFVSIDSNGKAQPVPLLVVNSSLLLLLLCRDIHIPVGLLFMMCFSHISFCCRSLLLTFLYSSCLLLLLSFLY